MKMGWFCDRVCHHQHILELYGTGNVIDSRLRNIYITINCYTYDFRARTRGDYNALL